MKIHSRINYAKEEISRLNISEDMKNDIMSIVKTLSKSNYNNAIVGDILIHIVHLWQRKLLTPLTGDSDEWIDCGHYMKNKRCPAVRKQDGKIYYLHEHYYYEPDGGNYVRDWEAKEDIEFPCYPPEWNPQFYQLFFPTKYIPLKWAIKFHLYRNKKRS